MPTTEHTGRRSGTRRVRLLHVADELIGVDLAHMQEVLDVETVRPVPGLHPAVLGVANIRGIVVPLIDLHRLLGLSCAGATASLAAVLRHEAGLLAVRVDRIPELQTPRSDESATPVDPTLAAWWTDGVLATGGRVARVLDMDAILAKLEADGLGGDDEPGD